MLTRTKTRAKDNALKDSRKDINGKNRDKDEDTNLVLNDKNQSQGQQQCLHLEPIGASSVPWTVRLSWLQIAYSRPLSRRAILTSKVGRTDLVFGARSGFISRCV